MSRKIAKIAERVAAVGSNRNTDTVQRKRACNRASGHGRSQPDVHFHVAKKSCAWHAEHVNYSNVIYL
jgi:hypothetical protein